MARKVLKNKTELIKFINNHGIAKRLKGLASMFLITRRKFNFKLTYDDTSCTNGTDVYISVPKYLIGHTKEEVFYSLKALTAHEIEHINSSDFIGMGEFFKNFAKYFKDNHDIDERISDKVAKYLNNCIEDGRIERLTSERNPGIKKPIIYNRSLWWQNEDLTVTEELGIEDLEKDLLFNTIFAICTIATMGQYPKGYLEKYDYEEFEETINSLKDWKKHIFRCVDSNDSPKYFKRLWELIYVMEEWLAKEMKRAEENTDFDKTMDDMLSDFMDGGDADKSASSIPSGGGSSKPMPSAPIKPSENEEEENNGSEEEENGSTENNEDNESLRDMMKNHFGKGGKDNFTEGSMEEAVREAMREAEEEINKNEHDTIVQADIDDLKIRKEEKSSNTESDIEEKELNEILEDYEQRRWETKFKIHRFNYPLMSADTSVLDASKKIKKEFETIFLNKVSRDVKNKRRGVLDRSSLYKTAINDYKCFTKKANPNKTDFAFYILVDGSGSMHGNKFYEAYKATAIIEECLGSLAPLKIVQFDQGSKGVNHYIVKDFNDTKKGNYSNTFAHHNSANNSNMDGFSIRVATEELLKRKEQKKVLIILSDGLPAGYDAYYDKPAQTDVKNAIRYARKKQLHVFNIMFGEDYERRRMVNEFKYMYEKGIVSCSPEDIGRNLCNIVKKEIKR